jgi:hypothetical protein
MWNYQLSLISSPRYNRIMKTQPNHSNHKLPGALFPFLAPCLVSAILLLAGAGCKNETKVNTDLDPTGVYALVSVDGNSLPCSLTHEGASPTIKSGTFTITADSHCRSQITFSLPARGDMSREVNATYTRRGAELTMQWEGAGVTMGNVQGNTFTMTNEGMVFAYRK